MCRRFSAETGRDLVVGWAAVDVKHIWLRLYRDEMLWVDRKVLPRHTETACRGSRFALNVSAFNLNAHNGILLKLVGRANCKAIGIHRVMIEEIDEELILVIPAHPNIVSDAVLSAEAGGVFSACIVGVVPLLLIAREVETSVTDEKLSVGMDVTEAANGVNRTASDSIQLQFT